MKKLLAMLVVAAMLASLGILGVSAEVSEADWEPFGEVKASYVENLSELIKLDGDVSDWQSNGFEKHEIDQYNLDAWVGEVDEDWSIDMWFSADAEFLYIAFKINDDYVMYSNDDAYDGDAFQIQLDFNGWAAATEGYNRAVFYSFGLQEDGTVDMTVQCIADDDASTKDYSMASDDEEEWREGYVKGATKKAEDGSGWYAEVAIAWQTLYDDIAAKLTKEELPDWNGGEDEVFLNMLVCYLDHVADDPATTDVDESTAVKGAWGTSNAIGAITAGDGWYPENSGMTLKLSGMTTLTVEEATTEPPTEPEDTTVADENDSGATPDESGDASEAPSGDDGEGTTGATGGDSSCKGMIGAGALVAVLALGACVVAKKKD